MSIINVGVSEISICEERHIGKKQLINTWVIEGKFLLEFDMSRGRMTKKKRGMTRTR